MSKFKVISVKPTTNNNTKVLFSFIETITETTGNVSEVTLNFCKEVKNGNYLCIFGKTHVDSDGFLATQSGSCFMSKEMFKSLKLATGCKVHLLDLAFVESVNEETGEVYNNVEYKAIKSINSTEWCKDNLCSLFLSNDMLNRIGTIQKDSVIELREPSFEEVTKIVDNETISSFFNVSFSAIRLSK